MRAVAGSAATPGWAWIVGICRVSILQLGGFLDVTFLWMDPLIHFDSWHVLIVHAGHSGRWATCKYNLVLLIGISWNFHVITSCFCSNTIYYTSCSLIYTYIYLYIYIHLFFVVALIFRSRNFKWTVGRPQGAPMASGPSAAAAAGAAAAALLQRQLLHLWLFRGNFSRCFSTFSHLLIGYFRLNMIWARSHDSNSFVQDKGFVQELWNNLESPFFPSVQTIAALGGS